EHHPAIQVTAGDQEVEARFEERRWVFPREDCVILPVANTTAELIAHYLGLRLRESLEARTGCRPEKLRVAVDENNGQWAICEC
ncbi:MAG: 6-pyruvoyl tetrahydrobiopterin synthase, partial [Pirellulales bacterium]